MADIAVAVPRVAHPCALTLSLSLFNGDDITSHGKDTEMLAPTAQIVITLTPNSLVRYEELVLAYGHTVEFWDIVARRIGNCRRFGNRGQYKYRMCDVLTEYEKLHNPDLPTDSELKDKARQLEAARSAALKDE